MKHRLLCLLASTVGPLAIWLLCRFVRVHTEGWEHIEALRAAGRPYIVALWHSRLFYGCYYPNMRGTGTLVSRSRDGEYMVRVMRPFGHEPVLGSSSRGGASAAVELARRLRAGESMGLTVDGPRGPAEVVKPGIIQLAAATAAPIVPMSFFCRPVWRIRSWDRMLIPRGYGRGIVLAGEAIYVPADVDAEGREAKRRELQDALDALTARAEGWWDKDAAIPQN